MDRSQIGPFTRNLLKEQAARGWLGKDDLLWSEGIDDWTPAANLKDLFPETAEILGSPIEVDSSVNGSISVSNGRGEPSCQFPF